MQNTKAEIVPRGNWSLNFISTERKNTLLNEGFTHWFLILLFIWFSTMFLWFY